MPYFAQRTLPDGTIYEEEIPDPTENYVPGSRYGPPEGMPIEAVPVGDPVPEPLVPADTPPPPTQTVSYPTAGPAGNTAIPYDYGTEIAPAPSHYAGQPLVGADASSPAPLVGADAVPAPLNYAAAEPYGVSDRAIHAGGDSNTLRSQDAYGPPPLVGGPTYDDQGAYEQRYGTFRPGYRKQPPDYRPGAVNTGAGTGVGDMGLPAPPRTYNFGAAEPTIDPMRAGIGYDPNPVTAGDAFEDFARSSREFAQTPYGQVVNDAILGMAGPGGMSVGRVAGPGGGGMADDALRGLVGAAPDSPPGRTLDDLRAAYQVWAQTPEGIRARYQTWINTPEGRAATSGSPEMPGAPESLPIPEPPPATVRTAPETPLRTIAEPVPVAQGGNPILPTVAKPARVIEPIRTGPSVSGRPSLGSANATVTQPPTGWRGKRELRGRIVPPEPVAAKPLAEPARVADTPAPETPLPTEGQGSAGTATTAAPVGATPSRNRLLPSKRLAALLGVGAVGGAVVAANRGGGREVPAGVPEPGSAQAPLEPGSYSPSTNPSTPDDWLGVTTRSLDLMTTYSKPSFTAQTELRSITLDDGTARQVIAVKGMDDANGSPYVVGVVQGGTMVPVGNETPPEDFAALLSGADVGTAEPAATATDTPAAAGTTDTTGTAPVWTGGTSGGSSGGGGSWDNDWNNDWSPRSSGRSSGSWDDFEGGGYERDFTADDFMKQAGGDRKKAAFMAKSANRKRKSKGGMSSGGMWEGFPFNRPPSPIRQHILAAIEESKAAGRARK